MEYNDGKELWKVETTGGKTDLVHGYFSNFQAAERYVYDLFSANVPLCNLVESKPDKAVNKELTGTSKDEVILLDRETFSWWQDLYTYNDEFGDLYCEPEHLGQYLVTAIISKTTMHINEGLFDISSSETAADWLERHGASVRTVNCMRRKSNFCYRSIYYMADHAYDLYSVRNLGRKSLDEILSLLDKEGIKYVMEKPGFDEIIL